MIELNIGGEYVPSTIVRNTIDEETLLKAKAVEDASIFFHSEDKGCKIVEEAIYCKKARKMMRIKHCYTHHADCCMCGWEWGEHYHTHSKTLSNQSPIK